jgi:tetratricopeptide (TPR) repeat protein
MPAVSRLSRLPRLFGAAAGLLLYAAPNALAAPAGPTVRFDTAEGAKLSDVAVVAARASTDDVDGIDKVEFAVDDDLKATDRSTPYTFNLDTLSVKEGPHVITATAFDSKGRTAKAKINVVVDNELGKGAAFHADAAMAASRAGNMTLAGNYARRALAVEPSNIKAARALASVHARAGELGRAVDILEKINLPADEIGAREDLAALYVLRADTANGSEAFLKSSAQAAATYKTVLAIRSRNAASLQGSVVEQALAAGDAKFAAQDWDGAIREYQRAGAVDTAPMPAVNRLLLAYLNAGRLRDAQLLSRQLGRQKRGDEITQTLVGLMHFRDHDLAKAAEAVKPGAEAGMLPALIISAYVDMANGKAETARQTAEKAAAIAPDLAEVQLLRSFLLRDPLDAKKAHLKAMGINPMLPEVYAVRAFQYLITRDADKYKTADPLIEQALALDAKNTYAIMARSLSLLGQNRFQEAEPLLAQLLQMDPRGPDVHVAQALYLQQADKTLNITRELETARAINPDRWMVTLIPRPLELTAKVYGYRFSPVLTPQSLYPTKN